MSVSAVVIVGLASGVGGDGGRRKQTWRGRKTARQGWTIVIPRRENRNSDSLGSSTTRRPQRSTTHSCTFVSATSCLRGFEKEDRCALRRILKRNPAADPAEHACFVNYYTTGAFYTTNRHQTRKPPIPLFRHIPQPFQTKKKTGQGGTVVVPI